MTSPRETGGRARGSIRTALACALLLVMGIAVLASLRRALPGAGAAASTHRLRLAPGESAWQTLYLPACVPRRITLALPAAIEGPGILHAAWFVIADGVHWPEAPVREMMTTLAPGDRQVRIDVPAASEVGSRLAGLRVTADGTAVTLPVTREDRVPRGYLTRRAGYISTDDLVFAAEYDAARWRVALACATQTPPSALLPPLILLGAMLAVCAASAWLAGVVEPKVKG